MTHFNLFAHSNPAGDFLPGTSATPATIWLDPSHKLTIHSLPTFIREQGSNSWNCLDRTRRVSSWRYTQTTYHSKRLWS